MEILYPVSPNAPTNAAQNSSATGSVTALVECRVNAAEEAAFLEKLRPQLEAFAAFPGTEGSLVFRSRTRDGITISILQRFADAASHDAWLASEAFANWRRTVAPAHPNPDHVHRYSGLESLFVSAQAPDAPPRWKMAVLLAAAVYPLSLSIAVFAAPALARLPLLVGPLLTSVVMVALMTYVIAPALTKCFQWWLTPARRSHPNP